MNKRGEGEWIAIIVVVFVLIAIWIGYNEEQKQEIIDLQANITKLKYDFDTNLTIITIKKEICENKISVILEDRFSSINWDEAMCEEFC